MRGWFLQKKKENKENKEQSEHGLGRQQSRTARMIERSWTKTHVTSPLCCTVRLAGTHVLSVKVGSMEKIMGK